MKTWYDYTDHKRKPTKLTTAVIFVFVVTFVVAALSQEPIVRYPVYVLLGLEALAIVSTFFWLRVRPSIGDFFKAKKSRKKERPFETKLIASEQRLRH